MNLSVQYCSIILCSCSVEDSGSSMILCQLLLLHRIIIFHTMNYHDFERGRETDVHGMLVILPLSGSAV